MWKVSLEKAKEALTASEICFEKELFNSCVSRAYYSIFWTAIAALEYHGFARKTWSHQGLANTFFLELIKKTNIFDKRYNSIISLVYAARLEADYKEIHISQKKTERILRDTKEFLNTVEKRLPV